MRRPGGLGRLGQRRPVLRGQHHGGRQSGEGEVTGAEGVAEQEAPPVAEARGDGVEGPQHAAARIRHGARPDVQVAADQRADRAEQQRERPPLPGRDAGQVVLTADAPVLEDVGVDPAARLRSQLTVQLGLQRRDLRVAAGRVQGRAGAVGVGDDLA
jgi:hypothetical protein